MFTFLPRLFLNECEWDDHLHTESGFWINQNKLALLHICNVQKGASNADLFLVTKQYWINEWIYLFKGLLVFHIKRQGLFINYCETQYISGYLFMFRNHKHFLLLQIQTVRSFIWLSSGGSKTKHTENYIQAMCEYFTHTGRQKDLLDIHSL